jgi:acyloxyacyl hydrolase
MKRLLILVVLCLAFVSCYQNETVTATSDGTKCAICAFALTEVAHQIEKGAKDIAKLLAGFCQVFSSKTLQHACEDLMTNLGSEFIKWLLRREDPDWICNKVGLCKSCHLKFDGPTYYSSTRDERKRLGMDDDAIKQIQLRSRVFAAIFEAQFQNRIQLTPNRVGAFPNIPPKVDLDSDGYSSVHLCHRGADWRGKDCNDLVKGIHPGVAEDPKSSVDGNCNGISGLAPSGKSWEAEYCQSIPNDRSIAFFGDSATAAFSIPVQWVDLNLTDIFPALVNELDWPSLSYASGWDDSVHGESLYTKLRINNRCAHRQFQNLAFNGATMANLVEQINSANFDNAKPVLAFIGYIGNDVCKKSLNMMTTPTQFRQNLLAGLQLLDQKLPPNSRVVLFGLVDGEILWNNTYNLPHPLGMGITYADFYKFLSCVGMNPCNTWLTADAASRRAATLRSIELDDVVEQVVTQQNNYKNFKLAFLDFAKMLEEAIEILKQKGLPVHELIDDIDGFHPSLHVGHRLLADVMWQHLSTDFPDHIGPANPHNAQIDQQFGDQGGY